MVDPPSWLCIRGYCDGLAMVEKGASMAEVAKGEFLSEPQIGLYVRVNMGDCTDLSR